MPSTLQAALVFAVAILPGFLARSGYSRGRPSLELEQGLAGLGRAFTYSTFIALAAWPLGGDQLYYHARAGTALTVHAGATYSFAVALFLLPPVAGFVLAELTDGLTTVARKGRASATASTDHEKWHRLLERLTQRLLSGGPTTWDRTWTTIRSTQPLVYVRITTKSGNELVGTVARESRIAVSPQPRDLYLEEVLRHPSPADPAYFPTRQGLGAFVSGAEIETVEFLRREAIFSA